MRLCSSHDDSVLQTLRMLRLFALCTILKLILCLMQRVNELEFAVVILLGLSMIFGLQSRKKGKVTNHPIVIRSH